MSAIAQANNVPAGFTKRSGGAIKDAHNQWRFRSPDEAVYDVDQLIARTSASRVASEERAAKWDDLIVVSDGEDLALASPDIITKFNNHSFQQLCSLPVGSDETGLAPADFLAKLSTELAAQNINERLREGVARKSDACLLLGRNGEFLRRLSTEKYETVWDHELALRISDLCIKGGWGPAEAFKRAGKQKPAHAWGKGDPLPLGWVGERSMFVVLIDYEGAVEIDGQQYARFFLLNNSEVGSGTLRIIFGLLDFVCCNFIFWGCREVYEANFRHTKSIHDRWNELAKGFTHGINKDTRKQLTEGISLARTHLLAEVEKDVIVVASKLTELPRVIVADGYKRAEATDRYGDPRSVWGLLNGITEASQYVSDGHADKRAAIDAKAAKLMGALKR